MGLGAGNYDRIVNESLLVRRVSISANHLLSSADAEKERKAEQFDLFTDYEQKEVEKEQLQKENRLQHVMVELQGKFGKNAILKGMNLQERATTKERNSQIGGHKA